MLKLTLSPFLIYANKLKKTKKITPVLNIKSERTPDIFVWVLNEKINKMRRIRLSDNNMPTPSSFDHLSRELRLSRQNNIITHGDKSPMRTHEESLSSSRTLK